MPMVSNSQIWVHWKGQRTGPFTREDVDALIARREISAMHRLEVNGTMQSVREYVAATAEAVRPAKPRFRLMRTGPDSAAGIDSSGDASDAADSPGATEPGGAEGKSVMPAGRLEDEFIHLSREVVAPARDFFRFQWLTQGRTALLLAVVLPPVCLFLFMSEGGWGREWFGWLSGYLTVLWMILFGLILRPARGAIWKAIVAYAGTVLLSLTLWGLTGHSITEHGKTRDGFDSRDFQSASEASPFFQRLATEAISEEICKLLVVVVLLVVFRKRLSSRDALYLGFVSGLGLGIVEGINYPMRIDGRMSLGRIDYYNNLALVRLIALPLLQAVWTAIAAYFLNLAVQPLPRLRYGLIGLALLVPASLHAAYISLSGWPALVPCAVSVLILMIYARASERALPGAD